MFHENQQIGQYTLIRKLGKGGFGEVWLAETDGDFFAIKLPHKDQVDWKSITQEIGLWTLCGKHPNVMPLIGARNFNGQIAIISEYAPDGSLEDLLRKKGKLSVEEAVGMTIGILEGLQHLHESGIIHRDLKPANILLDGKTPRLTDFGISRIISADSLSETISGTWAYMAPECFDGKRNVQTDIWSVGVILYRMLTGNLPFPQKEQTALVGSIIMSEPDALPNEVSSNLCTIVLKTLKKKPTERYQQVEDLYNELRKLWKEFSSQPISIVLAKRIGHGRMRIQKGISRSPVAIEKLIQLAEDLKLGLIDISEFINFSEQTELLGKEVSREDYLHNAIKAIDNISNYYGKVLKILAKVFDTTKATQISDDKKFSYFREIARLHLCITKEISCLNLTERVELLLSQSIRNVSNEIRKKEREIHKAEDKLEYEMLTEEGTELMITIIAKARNRLEEIERLYCLPVIQIKRALQIILLGECKKGVAKHELIKEYMPIVVTIAKEYVGPYKELNDLIQEGNIGLMKATDKFEWQCGVEFSIYASKWIRRTIEIFINKELKRGFAG